MTFIPEVEMIPRAPQAMTGDDGKSAGSLYAFMVDPASLGLQERLATLYKRSSNLFLKVFRREVPPAPLNFIWGGRIAEGWDKNSLVDCTIAQNLLARRQLAPRVYGLILLRSPERLYIAQVTEWARGRIGQRFTKGACSEAGRLLQRRGVTGCFRRPTARDWIGGWYVDFQCCQIDHEAYRRYIGSVYRAASAWKGTHGRSYQAVPELGLAGVRDTAARVEAMRWDEFDFQGKTVLDIGCNTGAMMREAYRRGASKVTGVDRPETVEVAFDVTNYLRCWNADFQEAGSSADLLTGLPVSDVVLFLSMNRISAYSEAVAALARETLFVESHPGEGRGEWETNLNRDFARVEYLGHTSDAHKRCIWRCQK